MAGKIQNRVCNNNIYLFSFIDSKSIKEKETIKNPLKFVLKMIYPEKKIFAYKMSKKEYYQMM